MHSVTVKKKRILTGYPVLQEKTKVKARSGSWRGYRKLIVAVLFLAFLCLTYIYLQYTATVLGYQVNRTYMSIVEIQRENKIYELEAQKLRSLDRVESLARNKLRMEESKRILLDDSGFMR